MKINPIAIQAYQHLNRQDKPTSLPADPASGSSDKKVVIEPQSPANQSALAVRGPSGNYAQYLSSEERQALDTLFDKFRDAGRFGSGYQVDSESGEAESPLGRVFDVKV